MNIVKSGNRYQVYGNDLQIYKELPIGCYEVQFNPLSGFYLVLHKNLDSNEETIYGRLYSKNRKSFNCF